ncbi:MAG TPA: GxxExxY protein [Verrucomicrobiae bacterium]|nr:GxxExxY protein [Verrucomicrobiae bacterium]
MNIIYKIESFDILGACFEVYKEKGCGFLESVYQECLEMELRDRRIPFKPKFPICLKYKGRLLQSHYIPDLVCYDRIIVELKAVTALTDEHRAQVQNYLRATGMKLGFLINFAHFPKLEYERIVL